MGDDFILTDTHCYRMARFGLTYVSTHVIPLDKRDNGNLVKVICFKGPDGQVFEIRFACESEDYAVFNCEQTGEFVVEDGVTWSLSAVFNDADVPEPNMEGGNMTVLFKNSTGLRNVKIEWSNYHEGFYVHVFQIGDKKFMA